MGRLSAAINVLQSGIHLFGEVIGRLWAGMDFLAAGIAFLHGG